MIKEKNNQINFYTSRQGMPGERAEYCRWWGIVPPKFNLNTKVKYMQIVENIDLTPTIGDVKRSGMTFKAKNGKIYRLCRDEYISKEGFKIYQTHSGWFYHENIGMWCIEIGEGSEVLTPLGEIVEVKYIFPNGTIEFGRSISCSDGKSYREIDLQVVRY